MRTDIWDWDTDQWYSADKDEEASGLAKIPQVLVDFAFDAWRHAKYPSKIHAEHGAMHTTSHWTQSSSNHPMVKHQMENYIMVDERSVQDGGAGNIEGTPHHYSGLLGGEYGYRSW